MVTKVIIFDFWGTLVENGVWSPIKQVKTMLQITLPFSEYVVRMEKAMMTKEFPDLKEAFKAVAAEFNIDAPEDVLDEIVGMWNKSWLLAKPYEEVEKELQKLNEKYIVVLVSNTDNISINRVLDKFTLKDNIAHAFFSYNLGMIKTDPDFLKEVLGKLEKKAEECIYIGDSLLSDIAPAKSAGIKAIIIDRRNKRDYSPKIRSLKELEQHLTS